MLLPPFLATCRSKSTRQPRCRRETANVERSKWRSGPTVAVRKPGESRCSALRLQARKSSEYQEQSRHRTERLTVAQRSQRAHRSKQAVAADSHEPVWFRPRLVEPLLPCRQSPSRFSLVGGQWPGRASFNHEDTKLSKAATILNGEWRHALQECFRKTHCPCCCPAAYFHVKTLGIHVGFHCMHFPQIVVAPRRIGSVG